MNGEGREINWETGIDIYTLFVKQIIIRTDCIAQGTLHNTLNDLHGKRIKKERIYVYV